MSGAVLIRASLAHSPTSPWHDPSAFLAFEDGALVLAEGRIVEAGEFSAVRSRHATVPVLDWRGSVVLPGFVDAHVHFPQVPILGRLGRSLLDWLDHVALPEEARLADPAVAVQAADVFVRALVAHGTTAASVFGAHFPGATAALFEAADRAGVRLTSGLVVSDRLLRPELHVTAATAYAESLALIRRYHGHGRLQYAVTPRFALSTSEALLEVCQALLREHPTVRCQSHINEHPGEVAEVMRLFPWATDYLSVYERYGLDGRRAILAHDVHGTPYEMVRLAAAGTAVAHCPASNAALGSGIFPLRRHLEAGVRCALGTDVGGGTGFGLLKEGLQAYLMQRVAPDPCVLSPAMLLHLATRAGAEALGLGHEVGDFLPGRAADFVRLDPARGSVLEAVLRRAESMDDVVGALFTLGDASAVREVWVGGDVVHQREAA